MAAKKGRPKNPAGHAREVVKSAVLADAGISHCIKLMTSGEWVRGRTGATVAEEFGVSPRTVETWAAQANRVILHAIDGDKEGIRARMLATLDHVVATHLAKDGRTAVAAIAEQAKLLGIVETRHKVEVSVQQYAALTDDQMLEAVESKLVELDALRTKLLAKKAIPALPVATEDDDE